MIEVVRQGRQRGSEERLREIHVARRRFPPSPVTDPSLYFCDFFFSSFSFFSPPSQKSLLCLLPLHRHPVITPSFSAPSHTEGLCLCYMLSSELEFQLRTTKEMARKEKDSRGEKYTFLREEKGGRKKEQREI